MECIVSYSSLELKYVREAYDGRIFVLAQSSS